MELEIRVGPEDFDAGAEQAALLARTSDVGGVAAFTGCVRGRADGRDVVALELEHYPGMTERSLAAVAEDAAARWPLAGLTVIHRVGRLSPGAQIVLVLAASAHRQAAFDAARFVMDQLKTRAVFWKREVYPDGARWVRSRDDDLAAAAAWEPAER